MNIAKIAHREVMRAQEVTPSPAEAEAAASALAEVAAELPELGRIRVRFFDPCFPVSDGTLGQYWPAMPRTVWVRIGQDPRDVRATVRHEAAHAAEERAGTETDHGTGPGWERGIHERYALGSPKARKRLRRGLRDAAIVYRIILSPPKETAP